MILMATDSLPADPMERYKSDELPSWVPRVLHL